jgi:hypothetical protein
MITVVFAICNSVCMSFPLLFIDGTCVRCVDLSESTRSSIYSIEFIYAGENKREKLLAERGKFDYSRCAKHAASAHEI